MQIMLPERSPQQSGLGERVEDREKVIESLFGREAREGHDEVVDGEIRHVPGLYEEEFSGLNKKIRDAVLDKYQEKAKTATNLSNMGALVIGRLRLAVVEERIKQSKKQKNKKQVKIEKEEKRTIRKRLKKLKRKIFK